MKDQEMLDRKLASLRFLRKRKRLGLVDRLKSASNSGSFLLTHIAITDPDKKIALISAKKIANFPYANFDRLLKIQGESRHSSVRVFAFDAQQRVAAS